MLTPALTAPADGIKISASAVTRRGTAYRSLRDEIVCCGTNVLSLRFQSLLLFMQNRRHTPFHHLHFSRAGRVVLGRTDAVRAYD